MADEDRFPCKVCGRKFAPEALSRHQKICKNVQKPRKVFDSSKQRATEDLSAKQIKQAQKKDLSPPKTHWREKHQDFINAVRSSKGVTKALETGGPLPPPPPPSINPDYISCPYCSRRFNEKAASRHIDFCKEQSMRLPKGKADPVAKAKQATRLNYQAPKLKAKTTSQPSTPAGRGVASGRGAAGGPGSRAAPATRGRAGGAIPAAGRYNTNTQDDDFSPFGQHGTESTPSAAFDMTSPSPASYSSNRSGYSNNNSHSRLQQQQQQQHHPPTGRHHQQQQFKSRTQNLSSNNKPASSHPAASHHAPHNQQQKKTPLASTKKNKSSMLLSKLASSSTADDVEEDGGPNYNSYLDSYRDTTTGHAEKPLNNFPDHFNKRYKTKNPNHNNHNNNNNNNKTNSSNSNSNGNSPVPSYTKNKPPTHFHYLNSIENDHDTTAGGDYLYYDDNEDDDWYLYSNSNNASSSSPPASLYGHSSSSKAAATAAAAASIPEMMAHQSAHPHQHHQHHLHSHHKGQQQQQQQHHYGNAVVESGPQSGSRTKPLLSYCHECGAKYPVVEAKFCCECGGRRPAGNKDSGRGDPTGGASRYSRQKH